MRGFRWALVKDFVIQCKFWTEKQALAARNISMLADPGHRYDVVKL